MVRQFSAMEGYRVIGKEGAKKLTHKYLLCKAKLDKGHDGHIK